MDATTKQPLTFEPPGPGPWDLDPVHFPRPVTAYWTEMHPAAFSLGYGDMMTFYGVPFQTRVTAYPNGFSYGQMVPVPPESFPDRVQRAATCSRASCGATRRRSGTRFASRPPCRHTTRSRRWIPMR